MKLNVQTFITQHSNWENILSNAPYYINISRDIMFNHRLIMFKYNQIDSSFNNSIVCECRGLILDEMTLKPISFPFTKFFNFGEPNAANIDWSTAQVGTKIDGSLIKIVNLDGNFLISTNGTINAFNAPISKQIGCIFNSFGDLVQHILQNKNCNISLFEPNWTYMFELTSPWTRVVCPFKNNNLWYLGRRNNITFQEEHFSQNPFNGIFDTPKVYPLKSIDECLATTKEMPWDEEGYVVCDAKFNRVKVKSPAYLAVHRLKGNGVLSYARAIELVRTNEIDEVIAYFPEFKDALMKCKDQFWKLVTDTENAWADYLKIDASLSTRKDKAIWITKNFKMPGVAFGLLDKKIESVKSFFMEVPTSKLLKYLGYKDE